MVYSFNKTVTYLLLVVFFVISSIFLFPTEASAATDDERRENCEQASSDTFLGLPNWYKYLDTEYDSSEGCSVVPKKDGNDIDIGATVGAVLLAVTEVLLRIAGIVAVGFVVYGGILYTMSQGEPERLGVARKTIINGVIGLVVAALAVAIVNLTTGILIG